MFKIVHKLTSHKQMGLYDFFVYKIRKKIINGLSAESPNNTTLNNYEGK